MRLKPSRKPFHFGVVSQTVCQDFSGIPSALNLSTLEAPDFTTHSSVTEEGNLYLKIREKQKYCPMAFQLTICLQKAFNF